MSACRISFCCTAIGVPTASSHDLLGIPVKVNAIPEGSRTAFRSQDEQQSERSDAGDMIVQEVFVIVKGDPSEAKRREDFAGIWGAGERGSAPLAPASSM
jgi:hypothetical protein